MAIKFSETQGEAKKNEIDFYKYVNGSNKFRLIGDVLARYVYWLEVTDDDGKAHSISLECLSFDRDKEQFTNIEKDWVQDFFPEEKCSWNYVIQCIDANEPTKIKVLPLKKKMFAQILEAARKLKADPTNIDEGFWITVDRKKTGPNAFNVEYTVDILQCKEDIMPLTEDEKKLLVDIKAIDELFPRAKPESQRKFIEEKILKEKEEADTSDFDGAEEDTDDFDDDTPF